MIYEVTLTSSQQIRLETDRPVEVGNGFLVIGANWLNAAHVIAAIKLQEPEPTDIQPDYTELEEGDYA